MLINLPTPTAAAGVNAALRPFGGIGSGACTAMGAQVGPYVGCVIAERSLPRHRWVPAGSGNQPASRSPFKQMTTQIDPVTLGGVGPHPAREPEPV